MTGSDARRVEDGGVGQRGRLTDLVETSDRASHGVPERQQERTRAERLLPSRELVGILLVRVRVSGLVLLGHDLGTYKCDVSAEARSKGYIGSLTVRERERED